MCNCFVFLDESGAGFGSGEPDTRRSQLVAKAGEVFVVVGGLDARLAAEENGG